MEARTSVAGSPGSEEITRSPDHSDVNDLEGKPELKVLRRSMLGWIFRIEKGDLDGLKVVPPLEIIFVPDLIGRAWYPNRLVPWIAGFFEVETYLGYLEDFFHLNHDALPTLDVAIDQCLGMENKLVNSRAADPCDEESSLSESIMSRIEEIKARQDSMSKEESCLAASGFMCITTEAMVMSELTDELSNCVRRYALDLMVDKGSGYAAVSAALLGMATEAKLMLDLLKRDQDGNSYLHSEFSTCCTVRTRTLALFTILQKSDALGFVGDHDRGVATSPDVLDTGYKSDTDQVKMDKRGTDVDRGVASSAGKKDRGVGALETRYNSDTDQVKMDKKGTGVAAAGKIDERLKVDVPPGNIHRGKNSSEIKKMNGIRKTKAFIKSLLPKRMKGKSTQE